MTMDIESLCAKIYRERLDKTDQQRVTDEQCRTRGAIYRPVVQATVNILGITLPESAKPEEDYSDLC